MPRHAYRQRQCAGPWAQPPTPPDIKVDLLPHSAKLHQERQQDELLRMIALFPRERDHICVYLST